MLTGFALIVLDLGPWRLASVIPSISRSYEQIKFAISDTFSVGKFKWLRSPLLQFQWPTVIAGLEELFPFVACISLFCSLLEKCGTFFFFVFLCFVIFFVVFVVLSGTDETG